MTDDAPASDLTAILTLDQIAAATDRPEVVVPIPEWGGSLKVRALSYDQLAAARQRSWDTRKKETNEDVLNAWCLSLGMVEPTVSFTQAKSWIIDRAFGPVNTVLSAILTASGLGGAAQADAKSDPAEQPSGDL